jgi:hypothetical protein
LPIYFFDTAGIIQIEKTRPTGFYQMDEREKKLIALRRKYLNLRYKIESYEMARNEPPPELIDKARIIGRMAEIPEEELNSF